MPKSSHVVRHNTLTIGKCIDLLRADIDACVHKHKIQRGDLVRALVTIVQDIAPQTVGLKMSTTLRFSPVHLDEEYRRQVRAALDRALDLIEAVSIVDVTRVIKSGTTDTTRSWIDVMRKIRDRFGGVK